MARVERHLRTEGLRGVSLDRLLLSGVLIAALVFAVGVGSGRSLAHVGGPGRLVSPRSYASDLLVVALAVFALAALFVAYALRPHRRRKEDEPERVGPPPSRWAALISLVVSFALVGGLIAAFLVLAHRHVSSGAQTPAGGIATTPKPPAGTNTAPQHGQLPPLHWWGIAGVGVVVLLAAILVWRAVARPSEAEVETPDRSVELREALAVSLDDIEREPDPRRAVIRAYARMERVLGDHGLARRRFETSLEYLGRALATERVSPNATSRLGQLFERAKFSTHDVDSAMKHDALVALRAVRDELEAAS